MNKGLALILTFVLSGCAMPSISDSSAERVEHALSQEVRDAITTASKSGDFRLYAFAGRKVTLPGLNREEAEEALSRCGTKFLAGTSDVLRTDADRENRRKQYDFASQYNQHMLQLCLNKS